MKYPAPSLKLGNTHLKETEQKTKPNLLKQKDFQNLFGTKINAERNTTVTVKSHSRII